MECLVLGPRPSSHEGNDAESRNSRCGMIRNKGEGVFQRRRHLTMAVAPGESRLTRRSLEDAVGDHAGERGRGGSFGVGGRSNRLIRVKAARSDEWPAAEGGRWGASPFVAGGWALEGIVSQEKGGR